MKKQIVILLSLIISQVSWSSALIIDADVNWKIECLEENDQGQCIGLDFFARASEKIYNKRTGRILKLEDSKTLPFVHFKTIYHNNLSSCLIEAKKELSIKKLNILKTGNKTPYFSLTSKIWDKPRYELDDEFPGAVLGSAFTVVADIVSSPVIAISNTVKKENLKKDIKRNISNFFNIITDFSNNPRQKTSWNSIDRVVSFRDIVKGLNCSAF